MTGCGAEVETEAYRAMPEVARLIGNAEKLRPAAWAGAARGPGAVMDALTAEPAGVAGMEGIPAPSSPFRTAATTAAPSASFPSDAGGRARSRPAP